MILKSAFDDRSPKNTAFLVTEVPSADHPTPTMACSFCPVLRSRDRRILHQRVTAASLTERSRCLKIDPFFAHRAFLGERRLSGSKEALRKLKRFGDR